MSMEHKGYTATVEFSAPDRVFHGRLDGIADIITFEGTSVDELEANFREAVDDYLDFCDERGSEALRPYSGRFVLRLSPRMHADVSIAARAAKESMNSWIIGTIQTRLEAWKAARVNPAAAEREAEEAAEREREEAEEREKEEAEERLEDAAAG
jgi:predicted HicB family RNase H-like nuclease